ncbi:EspA/EspE family type VII secretion system effector [Mycobacterium camsae]|uniref:EspA/EspE family type VII secretion system effector n=1 Tax=Mycobacterium gordonae TaxID=1778 RepID=UPI00197FDA66|nr:EspA/EspE family type VII secretion system effector [Mycobacterium gordonae]
MVLGEALQLIGNLVGVGQQFAGAGLGAAGIGGKSSDEYYASMQTSMIGDVLRYPAGKFWYLDIMDGLSGPYFEHIDALSEDQIDSFLQAGEIILKVIAVVDVLELMTGFGPPADGGDVEAGSAEFSALCGQLKSALPDSRWQGSASQAYAAQDTLLQNLAQRLAELDHAFAGLVKDQADWVVHTRLAMGVVKDILVAAFLLTFVLGFSPWAGPVVARVFALTVAALAMSTVLGMVGALVNFSVNNGREADSLAGEYREVVTAAGVVSPSGLAKAAGSVQGPAAVQSGVGSAGSVAEGGSGESAMPSVAVLAGSGMASQGSTVTQRATLGALTGDGAGVGDGSVPAWPGLPVPGGARLSWPVAPGVAAVTRAGQASGVSGSGGPPGKAVDQGGAPLGLVAAMAGKGHVPAPAARTAAAPGAPAGVDPHDAAALTGDLEGAGPDTNSQLGRPARPATIDSGVVAPSRPPLNSGSTP